MRRALLLALFLLAGARAAACPMCAGDRPAKEFNIWPIVGAFMMVPPVLATAVIVAIRRENKKKWLPGPDAGQ